MVLSQRKVSKAMDRIYDPSAAVIRSHYRGLLKPGPEPAQAFTVCRRQAAKLIREGRMMACGLYAYGQQIFLYYEALGEDPGPESFMGPLFPFLTVWPQKDRVCKMAKMYHIYWHQEPRDAEDWHRKTRPAAQRGRIAYLRHENMFEYVYHHFAIVKEGLLKGDRYMSIALHEDVLFSYFEEPRSSDNILRCEGESKAIKGWMDVIPEDHFIPLPGSNGQNFLLLPALFTVNEWEADETCD